MRKIRITLAAMMAALTLASCGREEAIGMEEPVKQKINLNITVGDPDPSTRAVKSGWETGDVINVWFDANSGQTPDMTLTYNGSAWDASEVASDVVANLKGSGGVMKFFWEGANNLGGWTYSASGGFTPTSGMPRVLLQSSDGSDNTYRYDAGTNTLKANLKWQYGTNFQVVITGLEVSDGYQLRCKDAGLYMVNNVVVGSSTMYCVTGDGYASRVENEDGVAFNMFLSGAGEKTFNFTLRDPEGKTYDWSTTKTITFSKTGAGNNFLAVKLKKEYFLGVGGHKYVDLGEGQLWATMNIGAASEEEVGSYFAWGETDSKSSYTWGSYAWGTEKALTRYVLDGSFGTVDGRSVLGSSDDAATALWGEGWRTPTESEWRWLLDNCTREIETVGGVTGFRFTSKITGHTSNSIFIPTANYYDGSSLETGEGNVTFYWTSTIDSENNSKAISNGLSQAQDNLNGVTPEYRYLGLPVRAVCGTPVAVTGIELSQSSISMELGGSPVTIGATVLPDNATNQIVIWSSSDKGVASIVPNGNSCNISATGPGTATITATTADGGYTATCKVTVGGVPTTGVTLDKTELLFKPGDTYQLTATVQPANASVKTVKWSSSNPEDVWVDENGKVTALAENGSSTITVTTDNGGFTAACEVTVKYIPVTSVSLDKTSQSIPAGGSFTLTATTLPDDATNPVVVWSSSDETIAKISSYDGNVATVTAAEDSRGGTATITASSEGGKVSATCEVTVTVPVTEVVITQENIPIHLGKTFKLEVSVRPIYATNQTINWSSSDPSVATVNSDGVVTAVALGSATITATSEDGGFADTCEITVITPVTGVTLEPATLYLESGEDYKLTVTVLPENATIKDVKWSSSNENAVYVNNGLVSAWGNSGSSTITVTTVDGGFTATCEVTVEPPKINGHAYVEMGVTSADGKVLKWATMNVGATSETGGGDYFAWGEAEPYYSSLNPLTWKDSKPYGYAWFSYFDNPSKDGKTFIKYAKDKKTVLELEDDAARQNWEGTWRMPTDAEWTQLRDTDNFTWEWDSDKKGFKVTSKMKGYEGNSIFLPASGYRNYTTSKNYDAMGYYWSSSLSERYSISAMSVSFNSFDAFGLHNERYNGYSVRAVSE